MKRGLSLITAFLVLASAFCVSRTVMSRERHDYTQENERYALLEDAFRERAKGILEERGYRDSGVTVTWTRDSDGVRSYRVEIHHRWIESLDEDGRERLTEELCCGELCVEVEEISIIYA